ncbi:MAG: hypothetical protein D3904_13275, partial [Candidatus Electrothrix sp. EH2]|nr:hypothetical protein [Candidatus Electrothrix sp. EH2]
RFDPQTRTLIVAVRLQAETKPPVPLVQGMFCQVDITGRSLENVFALPRTAVSFEQTVYVVRENRLHTRQVEVARIEENTTFIRKGLQEGEQVIITRLENPLEKALVRIEEIPEKIPGEANQATAGSEAEE